MALRILRLAHGPRIDGGHTESRFAQRRGQRREVGRSVERDRVAEPGDPPLGLRRENQRGDLLEHRVEPADPLCLRLVRSFDGEGTEANRVAQADRAQRVGDEGGVRRAVGLRDEQRPRPGLDIAVDDAGEAREVDVGRDEIDRRRAGPPFLRQVRQRPPAGVVARLHARPPLRTVDEQRQRVLGLARRGDRFDVARVVPGGEALLGLGAERLGPRQPARVERLRDRFGEGEVGRLAGLAGEGQEADLVLDLDHDDRALVVIDLAKMPHQRREGPGVGLARVGFELRDDLLPAVLAGRAHEAELVALDPRRDVARHRVLPRAEPQQHQPHVVRAGIGKQPVDGGEIEPPLLRLDQLPVDRREHGVEVHRLELGPMRPHRLAARSLRIAKFAAED